MTCAVYREGLVPAERLLVGLGLVPIPALLAAHYASAGAGAAAGANASQVSGAAPKLKHTASHSRRAVKHTRTARRFALHGPAKMVAAAFVVVAVAAGTVYAATRPAPTNASATIAATTKASAETAAATQAATPSATPTVSASPTMSPTATGNCDRAAGPSPAVKRLWSRSGCQ